MCCPAFELLRQQHGQAVEALRHNPVWVYAPCAVQSDPADVLSLIFHTRKAPLMPTCTQAPLAPEASRVVRYFTDGTCKHPTIPGARHAAWAVICDTTTSPQSRQEAVSYWEQTRRTPPHLRVADMGVVPGCQSAPRAELCAALQVIRLGSVQGNIPIHIVTDSMYVMHVLQTFSSEESSTWVQNAPNQDLLELVQQVWYPAVGFSKVKSHLDPTTVSSPEMLWDVLGNQAADAACELAIAADLPVVAEMAQAVADSYRSQREQLKAVFDYYLALNTATAKKYGQFGGPCAAGFGHPAIWAE